MKFLVSMLVGIALTLILQTSVVNAQGFGKAEVIKAAKLLEAEPLHKDAKIIRGAAVKYVIETDEVSVVVCSGELMTALLDKKNKNSSELIAQYTIAMAAFKLENPDKNDDENAAQLAGTESALRAYQAFIKEKPKTKHAGMDGLLAKVQDGSLKAMVEAADCGKK